MCRYCRTLATTVRRRSRAPSVTSCCRATTTWPSTSAHTTSWRWQRRPTRARSAAKCSVLRVRSTDTCSSTPVSSHQSPTLTNYYHLIWFNCRFLNEPGLAGSSLFSCFTYTARECLGINVIWLFTCHILVLICNCVRDWRKLKTLSDCLHGLLPAPFLLSYSVFDFCFFIIFRFWAVR